MAEDSDIQWTHHTFNPWIGCTEVSPACDNCYARTQNVRRKWNKEGWGPHAARHLTKTWPEPARLDRKAAKLGVRYRIFCASLADVFDNHRSILPQWRADLQTLILNTPNLDWLLLTKRPQNHHLFDQFCNAGLWPDNVWVGTTVENQTEAERRIPALLEIPAALHFLSCEPLLGPLDLTSWFGKQGIGWVITGGENDQNYRPANPDWFRVLRDQCQAAGVPFLFKQWEGKSQPAIKALGRELDGVVHDGYPTPLVPIPKNQTSDFKRS